jgi:hypothetical protein
MNNLSDLINETNENDLVIVNIGHNNQISSREEAVTNVTSSSHPIYWNEQSMKTFCIILN